MTKTTRCAHAAGDHVCWAYPDEESRREVFADFLRTGLAAQQRLVLIAPDPERRLESDLASAGLPVRKLLRDGRLVAFSTEDAYLPDGTFDADARLAAYCALIEGALADGFSGVRVAADATAVLAEPGLDTAWSSYELRADLLATRLPFSALCAYDRHACAADRLELVHAVHSRSLGNGHAPGSPFRLHALDHERLLLAGELDFRHAEVLRSLLTASAPDLPRLRLDVSRLSFVDAAGMSALAKALTHACERLSSVSIEGASERFCRIWSLLGFDTAIEVELVAEGAS
ncbi:MAG TPA: MEDS domain-containing protein [Gaiellaceae bacterium]|nr:MEDS domain-containing protein [Gaiellaceae bacterium]